MVEDRWNGWKIPEDIQQEVSYLIGLCARATRAEDRGKIDREIQDLIIWSTGWFPGEPASEPRDLSRRDAILEQRERRGQQPV